MVSFFERIAERFRKPKKEEETIEAETQPSVTAVDVGTADQDRVGGFTVTGGTFKSGGGGGGSGVTGGVISDVVGIDERTALSLQREKVKKQLAEEEEIKKLREKEAFEKLTAEQQAIARREAREERIALRERLRLQGTTIVAEKRKERERVIEERAGELASGKTFDFPRTTGTATGFGAPDKDAQTGVADASGIIRNEQGVIVGIEDIEQGISRLPTGFEILTGQVEPVSPIISPPEAEETPISVVDVPDETPVISDLSVLEAGRISARRFGQFIGGRFTGRDTFTFAEIFDPLRERLEARETPEDVVGFRIPSGTIDPTKEVNLAITKGDIQRESELKLFIKTSELRIAEAEKLLEEQKKLQADIDASKITSEQATIKLESLTKASEERLTTEVNKVAKDLTFFDFKTRATPTTEAIARTGLETVGFFTGVSAQINLQEAPLELKDGVLEPKLTFAQKLEATGPLFIAGGGLARAGRQVVLGDIEEAVARQSITAGTRTVSGKRALDITRATGRGEFSNILVETETASQLIGKNTAKVVSIQDIAVQSRGFFTQKPFTTLIRTKNVGDITIKETTKKGVFAGFGELTQERLFQATLSRITEPSITKKTFLRLAEDRQGRITQLVLKDKKLFTRGFDDLKLDLLPEGTQRFGVGGISQEGIVKGKRFVLSRSGLIRDVKLDRLKISRERIRGDLTIKTQRDIIRNVQLDFPTDTRTLLKIKQLPIKEARDDITIIRGGLGKQTPFSVTFPPPTVIPELSTQVSKQSIKSVSISRGLPRGTTPATITTTRLTPTKLETKQLPVVIPRQRIRSRTRLAQESTLRSKLKTTDVLAIRPSLSTATQLKQDLALGQALRLKPSLKLKQAQKLQTKTLSIPTIIPAIRLAPELFAPRILAPPPFFLPKFNLKTFNIGKTKSLGRDKREPQFLVESFTARELGLAPQRIKPIDIGRELKFRATPFALGRAPVLVQPKKRKKKKRKGGGRRWLKRI